MRFPRHCRPRPSSHERCPDTHDGDHSRSAQRADLPRTIRLLLEKRLAPPFRALVLGFTFKENCRDIRNSRVIDIVNKLRSFNVAVDVYEQAPELKELGAGVQISSNGTRVLYALGLGEAIEREGVIVAGKEIHPSTSHLFFSFPLESR